MNSFQKSIWSSDEPLNLHHRQSLTKDSKKNINNNQLSINAWSNETSENGQNDLKKTNSPTPICIPCCIVGSLLAGIGLTVILTLWLVPSSNTKTTSQDLLIIISSTSTISTTTETTTTTTVTIPTPALPCALSSPVSANILLTLTTRSVTNTIYNCYAFAWTSSVTGTVTLAFQFRNDFGDWNLDDVSVYLGATQMLVNGNFETGSRSPWIRTPPSPFGSCPGTPGAQVVTSSPHTGNYNLQDQCKSLIDKISQSFMTTVGQVYIVSFWLQTDSTMSTILANVTLS